MKTKEPETLPIRIEKTREYLRYDFTEPELKEFSSRMARTHQELVRLEQEKSTVMAQFKSNIEAATGAVSDFARKINNGYEYRNIDCEVRFNTPEIGRKRPIRLDTGEIVKTEAMTTAEMQEKLDLKSSDVTVEVLR